MLVDSCVLKCSFQCCPILLLFRAREEPLVGGCLGGDLQVLALALTGPHHHLKLSFFHIVLGHRDLGYQ